MSKCCSSKTCCEKIPLWGLSYVDTEIGKVLKIKTEMNFTDYYGAFKSRISSFRMKYSVNPGLYCAGSPDEKSPVLVTANYKLSFDHLRKILKNIDSWILVLDTRSINVWCAAGKGSFGTEELISKIRSTQLDKLITHKKIILPQLGAVGISAHIVEKETGFKIKYGPVRAKDIPVYLENNLKTDESMRRVRFDIIDRLVLTPLEMRTALKTLFISLILIMIYYSSVAGTLDFKNIIGDAIPLINLVTVSFISGSFLVPVLLPFIPFKSFAVKGWVFGLLINILMIYFFQYKEIFNFYQILSLLFILPVISSYYAFLFTGATTFTNKSGVEKEIKTGIPLSTIMIVLGLFSMAISKFFEITGGN